MLYDTRLYRGKIIPGLNLTQINLNITLLYATDTLPDVTQPILYHYETSLDYAITPPDRA